MAKTKTMQHRLLLKGILILATLLVSQFVAASHHAHAATGINKRISFQGKVAVLSNGSNVGNGSYTFKFRIYTSSSGDTSSPCLSTCIWEESKSLTVTNGVFQTDLGDSTTLPGSIDFNSDTLYLAVNFNSDGEMAPRIRLDAVPYAFNADKLNGLDATAFAQLSANNAFTGTNSISGSSAAQFQVLTGGKSVLTVDASGGQIILGDSGVGGILGRAVFKNNTNSNTAAIQSGVTTSSYSLTLPTALPGSTQCLVSDSGGVMSFTACSGGSTDLGTAYANDANGSDAIISLTATDGAIDIRDASSTITDLFRIQNNAGSANYLQVSSTATTLQDSSGNNAFVFDSTNSIIKVYENVSSPTNYASISYAGGAAIFAASSGITQIGTASGGNINLILTGAADQLLASKTNTPGAAYSLSDYNFTRTITGAGNAVTGNVLKVEDLSTFTGGGSVAPNVLYINQNNTSATGNLILAQTGGGANNKFKVDTSGTVTIAAGQSYTGAGALLIDSASGTALSIGTGASAHTATIGNTTGASGLVFNAGTAGAIFNSVASGQVLVTSGSNIPTVDQFKIDNSSSSGVVTANVNGLLINYKGGSAAVESAAQRTDFTPGTLTGGTWSGLRIVAGATGAVTGVTEYGIKLEGPSSPGSGAETGMYIGTGWDTGLNVQSGGINLAAISDPAAPATDNLGVYAKKIAGRTMLKGLGANGQGYAYQPGLFQNSVVLFAPTSGATVGAGNGFGTLWVKGSSTGTAVTSTPVTTAPAVTNQMHRFRHQNVVTTQNQMMGVQISAVDGNQFWTGNAAGLGGFFFQARFDIEAWPAATVRVFAGLTSNATSTAGGTNIVTADAVVGDVAGLWHDTTDTATTFNLVTRDNVTTRKTAISLTNAIAAGNAYDFYMYCKPNDTTIYYRLDDLVNGLTYEGNNSTNVPRNTIFMGPTVEMSNGSANTAVGGTAIAINRIYVESDR